MLDGFGKTQLTLAELRAEIAACVNGATSGDATPIVSMASMSSPDRPSTFDDYVGQERVRNRLEVVIASAKARGTRAEHIMLTAGPGQGKTTLAELIARLLGRRLVTLTKPPTLARFIQACEQAADGVLFVDEVHSWSKTVQQPWLMELTETGGFETTYETLKFPNLTVVAATTEPDKLLLPLVDRFGCDVKLDDYTPAEMVEIAAGMAKRCWPEGHELPDRDTLECLAEASAGVPRILRSLIFSGRDLALSGKASSATAILVLCDIDPDGCSRAHLDLLERLNSMPKGMAGVTTLATMLRVPIDTLRRTERLLVDRDYVALTANGRLITAAGKRRLAVPSIRCAA